MVKRHLKRLIVPRSWKIDKKTATFITRPAPGAHSLRRGISLNVVLRDMLGLCRTQKEVVYTLHKGEILIDKQVRKNPKHIVGLMDTVSIPKIDKHYRVLIDSKGKLYLLEITEPESRVKISKIIGKTKLKGDATQLNLDGARNIIVKKDEYKRGDVLLIELPSQKIKNVLKLEKGMQVYLVGGKHAGDIAKVQSFTSDTITLKSQKGEVYETSRVYQIVIGKDKPLIKLNQDKK